MCGTAHTYVRYDQFHQKVNQKMKKIFVLNLSLFLYYSTFSQITDTGDKVGIGVTNPSDKLEINSNSGGLDLTHSNSTSYSSIEAFESTSSQGAIQFIGSQFSTTDRRNTIEIVNRMSSGNIDFFTQNSFSIPKLRITSTGDIGIGTSTPSAKFHVLDNSGYAFGFVLSNTHSAGHGLLIQGGGTTGNRYILQLKDATGNDRMTIHDTGEVGIGTISTGSHQLAVEGSIGAREIKVEASGWSDFVFENDYELRTLEEVEQHINENGHLPEIPSEAEVTENGINLGEMNAKLLQKIEELTLYLIEQNKELKTANQRIGQMEQKISQLEN